MTKKQDLKSSRSPPSQGAALSSEFQGTNFLLMHCCPWAGNEEQHARKQVHWADHSADTEIYEGSLQTESAQI